MKFNEKNLYGIYDLVSTESWENEIRTDEKSNAGMFIFRPDHMVSVVSGSNNWVMAYTGKYSLNDDILSIEIKSCVVREMEGTTITRKILALDENNLIVDASAPNATKRTKITWKKYTQL